MVIGLLMIGTGALFGALGAWLMLLNGQRLALIQAPNDRSSHNIPKPSGGGVGFVLGGTLGGMLAVFAAPSPGMGILIFGVALSGLALATIGFIDDRTPLPARLRLGAQLILTLVLLAVVGALSNQTSAILIATALLIMPIVYWINLFNFMDGIDGLAASEALFIILAAVGLLMANAPELILEPLSLTMLTLAAAIAGFLIFNWPPAKIFMGDVGSTYLGFMLAAFALLTVGWGWMNFWQWLILGAAFIADASVTLLRRLLRGENIFAAHRRHAYQVQARRLRSHRAVTLIYTGINLVWLLPMAALAGSSSGWLLAIAAYLPLTIAVYFAGAGQAPD